MKKLIIPIGILIIGTAQAQLTNTENYVYSKTYLSDPTLPNIKSTETVQYFDGLGRAKQIVNVKASPLGKDVVIPIKYDQFGRQVQDYLPVPQGGTLNGGIITDPLANVSSTPYGSEKIYSEKIIENSPLDRVLAQKQVGTAWDNKPVQFEYDANADGEVKRYTATFDYNNFTSQLILSGSYGTGQLYKNTVTDEDGNVTIEFKNGQGQVILVRKVISATESANTYYVFNDYDQLAFVIPPKASLEADPNTVLNDLCYQYKYDGRNRLIEKKLPGKGWEYMIYNNADQLVMSQDALLRTKGQWLVTKYDQFGRVVFTAITNNNSTRQSLQTTITGAAYTFEIRSAGSFTVSGMPIYYTNRALPGSLAQVLSVNYYDTYPAGSSAVTNVFAQPLLTDNPANEQTTKGLLTASYIKNIEDDKWTRNFIWYDTKGRNIGSRSNNHLGGYTVVNNKLDFAGVILQTNTYHKRLAADPEKAIVEKFTYDPQNRLLTRTHQVGSNRVEYLTQNKYNEISQLESKKVGGTAAASPLQTVDYQYNIRGWMTKINDPANLGSDLFGYKINYNQVEGLEMPNSDFSDLKVKPKYNGNIAEVSWKTLTEDNEPLKRYGYVYDSLNRLSAGFYQKTGAEVAKEYFEKPEYDLNGNITRLKRSEGILPGSTVAMSIDNLKYDYSGNRLIKVTDEQQNPSGYPYLAVPNSIEYDNGNLNGNGNMTKHLDKGISSIEYNYLNLPDKITQNSKLTSYLYRADGVKVKKLFGDLETHYLDGFQYKTTFLRESWDGEGTFIPDPNEIPELKLRIIPTSEGYYDALLNKYVYNFTDHLGNVRLSYTDTNGDGIIQPRRYNTSTCSPIFGCLGEWKPGEIVEVNDFYPFGLLHNYTATTQNAYQYKYNGKELQETGMYDYGARFYMPDLGRWGVVDPLATEMRSYSPYNYAFNNPIRFIDPDGRAPVGGPGDGTDGKTYNIEEIVITVRRKTNNFLIRTWNAIQNALAHQYSSKTNADKYGGLNSYRQWQASPFYNEGETKTDRIFRLIGNSKREEMLDFGGGGYNMWGGYGRATKAVNAIEEASNLIPAKSTAPQVGESLGLTVREGNISIGGNANGRFDFVVTKSGDLKVGSGHYYLSGEANNVQAAGQIRLHNGQIVEINNVSGHYAPSAQEAQNFPSIISKAGVNTSNAKLTIFKE
ncbi:DUF6443 domain-containing protein [Chryseobacterium sediminis]|uniref:RHS repeat-associated core domain-containing protein n=1 Tax=Chryseobacterium sediminis TaxID=1679494 RepID=A0A5B2U9J7_9FLAO|nr:DUF6443 domain-containing protein [Chryseobacterium sediminis]KAA2222935.1 RHS repeat-associated core domain-containing protein [Chryseobacterium sediminis]